MKIRKLFTAVLLTAAILLPSYSQPALKYNGLDGLLLAQNDTESSTFETDGTTPRIKSKKRYEYKENKSPLMAAGMSLLVPGAGEFYGKDYIRSGIFFGIEILTLSMWYYYESEGDDKKDEYRDYADTYFSEDLYYGGLLGMTQNSVYWLEHNIDASKVWSYEYFSNRDNWVKYLDQQEQEIDTLSVTKLLDYSFNDNIFNNTVINLYGGSDQFTHNLPESKTQQYYEMVGKYHQFTCGWNDFDGYEYENGQVKMDSVYVKNSDGQDVLVVIPKLKLKDGLYFDYSESGVSAKHVDFYEDLRNETNEAYEMGQNFLMITLLNHVASAFDASFVIKSKYQIDTQLRIENNDKDDKIGMNNYKITYSVLW